MSNFHRVNPSRRQFLRASSLASATAYTAAPFALNLATISAAAAQSANDYRALVCVFMFGGNDHGNTVLATDPGSWSAYRSLRSEDSIGLPGVNEAGGVLPITTATPQSGRTFALHPSLAALRDLYEAGDAAVVANVGPLVEPLSKLAFQNKTGQRPPKLFSHNDQQSIWQAYAPEGARYGWGGRMGDLLASMNSNQTFSCISTSGNAVWLAGRDTIPYRVGTNGATGIAGLSGWLYGSNTAPDTLRDVITEASNSYFEQAYAGVTQRAIDAKVALDSSMIDGDALPDVPNLSGTATANRLAAQLKAIARIIAGRSSLGFPPQSFFGVIVAVRLHTFQAPQQPALLVRLAPQRT